jgi:large subunit ribosomal protein L22
MATATLKNYRQSPRKVRLVATLVKGKSVARAQEILKFTDKRAAPVLLKLLASAVANAGVSIENLFIKDFRVDAGFVMKRIMPRARGTAYGIKKRTSHVFVEVAPRQVALAKTKKANTKKS